MERRPRDRPRKKLSKPSFGIRKTKTRQPAPRVPPDSRAFLVEEKFDTWLDLGSIKDFQAACAGQLHWLTSWAKRWNRVVGAESIVTLFQSGVTPQQVAKCCLTPGLNALILDTVLRHPPASCHLGMTGSRELRRTAQEAATLSVNLQVNHMTQNISETILVYSQESYIESMEKMRVLPPEIVGAQMLVEDWMNVLDVFKSMQQYLPENNLVKRVTARLKQTSNKVHMPSIDATVTITMDLCIMHWKDKDFLVPRDMLLELVNKASELYVYLLYNYLQDNVSMPKGHYVNAVEFMSYCVNQITRHCTYRGGVPRLARDNKGFAVLKAMEGLGVAWMIWKGDEGLGWWNDTLLENLWNALYADRLVPHRSFASSPLHRLFSKMTVPQIADLIGCVKIAGHPSIEVERGLKKLYDRTHNEIEVDYQSVTAGIGVLTRDVCKQYYLKFKRYPKLDHIPQSQNDILRRTLEGNLSPIDPVGRLAFNSVPAHTWAEVLFGQNAEFDPIDNQLVLLKDKALGLERNKIWPILLERVSEDEQLVTMRAENRRALLSFILHPHFSSKFQEYLYQFEHDNPWRETVLNYLVIKLTPKEKEMKGEGRFFGASPMDERNRRVVQEENTMRFMQGLIPDQLMTQDELSTIRKLYSFRYYQEMYPDHQIFQVSFDFSKWNNNMRHDSVDRAASQLLDRWFGRNIWGKTMRAYEEALIYYTDHTRKTHWEGQFGGIEGLNQATWSLVFLGGVKHALERIGVIYQVTVKGDDVRAAIAVGNDYVAQHGHTGVRQEILTNLQRLCAAMGWELNPHETFVSLSLIATSKQYQYKNSWLPASSKKMIKAMSLANLLFPTHEDIISSIFSCAHSACIQATCIMPAFQCASLVAATEIRRFLGHRMEPRKITSELVAMMLMWPQILGGPGALPLQTFFVRGENDMLAVSLSLMRYLCFRGPPRIHAMAQAIGQLPFSDPPHFPLLLSDPYALCFNIPERASSLLKKIMRRHLAKVAKNHHLVRLLSIQAQQDRERLVEALCSMTPYCAKVATVLWECSPFYVIEEVLAKFLQSQTVFKFLSTGKNRRLQTRLAYRHLANVMLAAIKREKFWISTLAFTPAEVELYLGIPIGTWNNPRICTTEITHMVRQACWQRQIVGITYPSLVDQLYLYSARDIAHLWERVDMGQVYAEICVMHHAAVFQTDFESHHYCSASGSIPWIGATTSTNYHFVQGMTRVTSAALSKILKLVALRLSGNYLGRDFTALVDILIQGLTGRNMQAITVLQPELGGGHIPHRVACNSYSLTTMPNYRPNIMQLVRINKEAHAILRGDVRDRTINYAAKHFFGVVYATLPLQFATKIPPGYPEVVYLAFHHNVDSYPDYELCPWCCHIIDDEPVTLQIPHELNLTAYQRIPLVGTSEYDEHILQLNMDETLLGRGHAWAEEEGLDANNPIVLTCATRVIMSKFSKAAQQSFMAARSQGYMQVPKGELCQFLAASNMLSSVQIVSMNMLRAMPDRGFYEAVLSETLEIVCSKLLSHPDNAMIYIDRLQPFLNPMAGLFGSIKDAGLLPKLADGANLEAAPPYGSGNYLEWRAGDPQDGHAASVTFMRHAASRIITWLERGARPTKWIIFVQYENEQTAQEALEAKYHTLMRLLVLRMLGGGGRQSYLKVWQDWLDQQAADFTNRALRRCTEALEDNPRFTEHLAVQYMQAIRGGHTWARDVLVAMMLSYRAYEWLQLNPGIIDQIRQGRRMTEDLALIEAQGTGDLHWEPMRFQNLPALRDLADAIPLHYWHIWHDTITEIALRDPGELNEIIYKLQDGMENVLNFIRTNVVVKLAFLNLADAERIIKNRFVDPEEVIFAERLYYRLIPPQLEPPDDFKHTCEIRGDRFHDVHDHAAPPALVNRNDQHVPDLQPFLGAFYYAEDPTTHANCYVDPLEPARVGGHLNTAVTKYAVMCHLTGAFRLCQSLGTRSVIVCTADGIGAVAVYCATMCPEATVVYNSLLDIPEQVDGVRDAGVHGPPAEICSVWGRPHSERIRREGFYPGDLTMWEVCQSIMNTARACGQVTLLTCDADINWKKGLAHHMKLLWNVTRLARETLHPQGLAIIKTFLLADPDMTRWIHFCATFFTHFHLHRCSHSRSHSLEIFVIIGGARGNAIFSGNWTLLRTGILVPQLHVEARNLVARVYQEVTAQLRQFHETGRTPHSTPLRNVWAYFSRCSLPPINVFNMVDPHCSLSAQQGLHLCSLLSSIKNALAERSQLLYHQLFMRHFTLGGARRARELRHVAQPHRPAVAVGRRLTYSEILLMFDALIISECLHHIEEAVPHRYPIDFYGIYKYILDQLQLGVANLGLDVTCEPDANHHDIIRIGPDHLDATDRARRMFNKALRIWGSCQYMMFLAGEHLDVGGLATHLWGRGITRGQCCNLAYNQLPQAYFDLRIGNQAARLNLAWQDQAFREQMDRLDNSPWRSTWLPWAQAGDMEEQLEPDVYSDDEWEDVE